MNSFNPITALDYAWDCITAGSPFRTISAPFAHLCMFSFAFLSFRHIVLFAYCCQTTNTWKM